MANPRTLTVTLPLPPASLNAHPSGSWRSKAADMKRCRERAMIEAIRVLRSNDVALVRGALSIDVYYPDLRRRDLLNTVQMCKAYIDGAFVDTHVLPDDDWQNMSIGHIRAYVDRANPRVVLTLTELP